jgi:hypothetical protein
LAGVLWAAKASLRFSLRELLLVMLVVAAFSAWLHDIRKAQQPLVPSHVAEYFANGLQQDVAAARSEVGESGSPWWQMDPIPCMEQRGVWRVEHTLCREWFCFLNLDWKKAHSFRDALERKVFGNIRQGQIGEHISTSEYESESMTDLPAMFFGRSVKYHCGETHGILRLYIVPADDKHAQVIASVNEWRVPLGYSYKEWIEPLNF